MRLNREQNASLDPVKHHYIRLERLRVNEVQEGDMFTDGVVESAEYYGLTIKYLIRTADQTFKVIEKNDGKRIYEIGENVRIGFRREDLMSYEPGDYKGDEV